MKAKLLLQFYIASFVAHTQTLFLQMKHNRPFYLFTAYIVYVLFCLYYHYSIIITLLPIVIYLLTFLIDTFDHPHIYYMKQSPFAVKILQNTPELLKDYKAPIKPLSGHILTTYNANFTPSFEQQFEREIVQLQDGGICAIDEYKCDMPKNTTIVYILPGILGDTKQSYTKKIVKYAFENGMKPIVYIKRGLDGLELKTDKMFNAITVDDVYETLSFIHKKYPEAYINIIGYSLGGSLATRLSYTYGEKLLEFKVNAICAVCPIWGLSSVFTPTVYDSSLVEEYKSIVMKHKELFEKKERDGKKVYDLETIKKCKSCKDMERELITPMFGYKNVEQYYWDVEQWFQNLPVTPIPTYTLTSFDDPVLNDQTYSYLRIKAISGFSPFVMNCYTQRGGHCIYTESLERDALSYADRNCVAFMKAVEELNVSGELEEMRKNARENFKWFE